MKYGFTYQVAKMSWAFCHASRAGLTPRLSIDDTLPGIHQTSQLGSPSLHNLCESDASFSDGHPPDLFRAQDSTVDPLDLPDRSLGVSSIDGSHGEWLAIGTTSTNNI